MKFYSFNKPMQVMCLIGSYFDTTQPDGRWTATVSLHERTQLKSANRQVLDVIRAPGNNGRQNVTDPKLRHTMDLVGLVGLHEEISYWAFYQVYHQASYTIIIIIIIFSSLGERLDPE